MKMPSPPNARGFTLMELMIAVAVIAILAAIALPSYRQYVMRTNRIVAKVALQTLAAQQESYATDHKSYAASFARLGYSGSGTTGYVTADGTISRSSSNALYSLQLHDDSTGTLATCANLGNTPTTNSYRISAAPVVAATDTVCSTLCISSSGARGAATGGTDTCWRRG